MKGRGGEKREEIRIWRRSVKRGHRRSNRGVGGGRRREWEKRMSSECISRVRLGLT